MWGTSDSLMVTQYVPYSRQFNGDTICAVQQTNGDTVCGVQQTV